MVIKKMLKHISTVELPQEKQTKSFFMTFIDDEIEEDDLIAILKDYQKEMSEKQYLCDYNCDYKFEFTIKGERRDLETEIYINLEYTDLQLADEMNGNILKTQEKDFMDFYNSKIKN